MSRDPPAGRSAQIRLGLVWLAANLGLAGAYFLSAKLGLALAFENASVTAVWPPTGLAIALLVLYGTRLAPGVFVGAFIANVTTAGSVVTSLSIGLGNTLEALIATYLIARFARGRKVFDRGGDVLRFGLIVAFVATPVSATWGVSTLLAAGLVELPHVLSVWLTWWLGDLVGALLVAPAVLLWWPGNASPMKQGWLERAAALMALGMVCWAIFLAGWLPTSDSDAFVAIPIILWAAIRLGQRDTIAAVGVLAGIALAGTLTGSGPFVRAEPVASLLLLQTFLGITSLTGLSLAAIVGERDASERALRASRDSLDVRVQERTASLEEAIDALRVEVDERRVVEEGLRQSQAQLARSQEIAHVGSWEWDVRTNHVAWSDELYRIFHIERGAFSPTYESYVQLLPEADRAVAASHVEKAMRDHESFEFDHRVIWPDMSERVVRGRGNVIVEDGAVVRLEGTAQDITEQVEAERERLAARERAQELERLKEADAFRSHLLSAVSHELKTPITPLKLQIGMLSQGLLGELNQRQERSVQMLARNLDRLSQLVDQTLDVARIRAGQIKLEPAPTDLRRIVEETAETYAEPARQAGVSLRVEGPTKLVVTADAHRLTQVLVNLVSNALKFTPSGGSVTIQISDDATVRVTDSGHGIPQKDIERLFQPFSQLEPQTGKKKPGSGLGLYISRGIIEAHGGRIWADSDGPGKGATFAFSLPSPGNA